MNVSLSLQEVINLVISLKNEINRLNAQSEPEFNDKEYMDELGALHGKLELIRSNIESSK